MPYLVANQKVGCSVEQLLCLLILSYAVRAQVFLTAKAYYICHIGPTFLISLIYAFIGVSVVRGTHYTKLLLGGLLGTPYFLSDVFFVLFYFLNFSIYARSHDECCAHCMASLNHI